MNKHFNKELSKNKEVTHSTRIMMNYESLNIINQYKKNKIMKHNDKILHNDMISDYTK